MTGLATGSGGTKVKSVLYFPTDPGYRDSVSGVMWMFYFFVAGVCTMFKEILSTYFVQSNC